MNSWDSQDSWSNYSSRPPANLEDAIYQHLQYWRHNEPAHELIERFRRLFLDGTGYEDESVAHALYRLSSQPAASREFKYVLNRCCYTLINFWYPQPRDHWAIADLIGLFDDLAAPPHPSSGNHRLQSLLQDFVSTEQYAALNRLRQIFVSSQQPRSGEPIPPTEQPLAERISLYPFLYDNSLLTKDSSQEQKQNILDLRRKAETDLGIRLARFHTYSRDLGGRDLGSRDLGGRDLGNSSPTINPTLLDSSGLAEALTHYTGKLDGNRTQKDLAHWFGTYSKTARCFRDFKDEFVDYLINPIARLEPKYANNHFTRSLRQYLRETLSEFDGQQLNSFIVVETCRRVLNFLVVDSPHRPVFRNFRHLLSDIGYTLTVGMLLRVVLFCSAAKPWLERCFSVLFNLHERRLCKDVPWLVTTLEHANVALITNFSSVGYQF